MTRYTPQWLQQGSYAASVDRRLIAAALPAPYVTGCAVSAASGMTVNIASGQVVVPTQNNTGSTLCTSDAVEQVTLAAAPAGGTNRYDLIVCQPRGNDLDGGANNDFVFAVVTGTAAASPTVPAVPNGQVALAQIYVPGASASVTAGNITDRRLRAGMFGYTESNVGASTTTEKVVLTLTLPALLSGRRYVFGHRGGYSTGPTGTVELWVSLYNSGAALVACYGRDRNPGRPGERIVQGSCVVTGPQPAGDWTVRLGSGGTGSVFHTFNDVGQIGQFWVSDEGSV